MGAIVGQVSKWIIDRLNAVPIQLGPVLPSTSDAWKIGQPDWRQSSVVIHLGSQTAHRKTLMNRP